MNLQKHFKRINIPKVIILFILLIASNTAYAANPSITSLSITPQNPTWGQQFVVNLQICHDAYNSENDLDIAVSTSNTFQPANSGGQIFLVSNLGIDVHSTSPNGPSNDMGWQPPNISPTPILSCSTCTGSNDGYPQAFSFNLTMPNAADMGTECGSTTLYLLVGTKSAGLQSQDWADLTSSSCNARAVSWTMPVPLTNSYTLNKRVEGVLQYVGDLVLFSIDYTYGNGGPFTITDSLPGGGNLALVSVGPSSISGGSVNAPAAGTMSGTVTWTFPSSIYTKTGTVWILMSMTTAMASGMMVSNTATSTIGGNNGSSSATLTVGEAAISVQKLESVSTFMKQPGASVTITYYLNYQINGDQLKDYRAFDDTALNTYTYPAAAPSGWEYLPYNTDYGTWTISDPCSTGDRILTGAGQANSYPALLLNDPSGNTENVQICTGIVEADVFISPGTYPGADGLVILRSNGQAGNNAEAYSLLLSIDTNPAGGYMAIQKCAGSGCTYGGASDAVTITGNTWYRTKTWMTQNGNNYVFNSKIWQIGQPEPSAYQVTWTDTGAAITGFNCGAGATYTDWRPGVGQQSSTTGNVQDSYNNFTVLIPRVAASAVLYDTIPAGLTYINSNPVATGVGGSPQMVTWSLGNISDQSGSYTWWASTSACGQSFTNVGGIGASSIVPEFSNPVVFNVLCVSPTNTPPPPGSTVTDTPTVTPTYTVTPTNTPSPTFTNTPTPTYTYTNTPTYTYTYTYTPTATSTNTPSVTPTYTQTDTYTYTYTPTATKTQTPTYSVTLTCTQTSTPTATPTCTGTLTLTYTYTQTDTYTFTQTSTSTNTQTPTYTVTLTNTQTSTPTATTTYTDTLSPTCTYTQTVTYTYTYTSTATNTQTPTYTVTLTNTQTPTSTSTPTYTNTLSPTYTYTQTVTYTYTYTATMTNTLTTLPTFTNTPTITPTYTASPTYTYTNTDTATYTQTLTSTYTITATSTNTHTNTLTATLTYTSTSTYTNTPANTSTVTQTASPTCSVTLTKTCTYTFTITITITATHTNTLTTTSTTTKTATASITYSMTSTETNTITASITNTLTTTATATITGTSQPFPYAMNISVYNEAGELVKVVANTTTSQEAQNMQLLLNGSQTGLVLPGSGTSLIIRMPDIETPNQAKGGYADFTWDGTNSAGQDVANGVYYIKETTTDPYGHTNTITKQVTALDETQYVQINIFNSAGELVQTIKAPYDGISQTSLNITNNTNNNAVLPVGNGAPPITINYTATNAVTWDGKNTQGNYLQSGVYEIQIVVNTNRGYNTSISKTVTILNEGTANLLGIVKSLPNPYTGNTATPLKFTWQPSAGGVIKIKVYNMAGELVRTLIGDLGTGSINWDLKSVSGQTVASGVYVCVVEGVDNAGNKERKIVKIFAIIGTTAE